jgi:C-terminal processing protease CtpA/Prc
VTGAPYVLMKQDRRIAVLTGPRTASSGEVVATAFRGLTHAKSFGLNTAGLSTANANFTLSDGSMIFLATSVYADRLENTYGGKLTPDYLIDFAYGQVGSEDDPVLKHAIAWVYKGTLSRDAK